MPIDSLLTALPPIVSGNLILRAMDPARALLLAEACAAPVALTLLRDAHLPGRGPASEASAAEPYATHQLPPWSIALAGRDHAIGVCGYLEWSLRHSRAPLVVALDPGHRAAYLAEVFRSVIDFGFRTMELNRIEAPLGRRDAGSREAVVSMGMRREGMLRKELLIDGSFFDVELYATVREEWPGLG